MCWYLVLKSRTNSLYLLPQNSKEDCEHLYKIMMCQSKYKSIIVDYKIIKRDLSKYKDGWII